MLGPLCNQTVKLKTDSKTLYLQFTEIKYTPPIVKHNKDYKKKCVIKEHHRVYYKLTMACYPVGLISLMDRP